MMFDLAITGAGPAGTACAIAAARAGWRVALIERAVFPRHKVCGDCLNPSVWPVLASLGLEGAVRALDHAPLGQVRFSRTKGGSLTLPLPPGAERAVTRESLDAVLLDAARTAGVTLFQGAPLTSVTRTAPEAPWHLGTSCENLAARVLVAADGRNSTTCRLLGLMPRPGSRDSRRVALQCHVPLDPSYQNTVALELTPWGYCGLAPVDSTRMNVCVVTAPANLALAKSSLHERFGLLPDQVWHSLAPLDRADVAPAPLPGCFLAGDAARVVEPFTGEGIFYALSSGQLAAAAAGRHLQGLDGASLSYQSAWRQLYQRRLWINRLTRIAVTHRSVGNALLGLGQCFPSLLQRLTSKIMPVSA